MGWLQDELSKVGKLQNRAYDKTWDIAPNWISDKKPGGWLGNYQKHLFNTSSIGEGTPFGYVADYYSARGEGKGKGASYGVVGKNALTSAAILAAIFGGSSLASGAGDSSNSAGDAGSAAGDTSSTPGSSSGSSDSNFSWQNLQKYGGYLKKIIGLFGGDKGSGGSSGGTTTDSGAPASDGTGSNKYAISMNPPNEGDGSGDSGKGFFEEQLMNLYQQDTATPVPANDFSPLLAEFMVGDGTYG